MEDWQYSEALRHYRSFLVEEYTVESDVDKLANNLHMHGHITHNERQDIDETTPTTIKMQRLVDILISKCQSNGHSLYAFLIRELNECGRKQILTKLLLTLKTVKTLPKPTSEIHRCLTRVSEYIIPKTDSTNVKPGVTVCTDLQTNNEPYARLVEACGRGDVATVKQVLSDTPECINTVNDRGETVLMETCRRGTVSIVKALLMSDLVDVNVKGINGLTAIMTAISRGDVEILSAMLDSNKVDYSIHDGSGLLYLWHILGEEMLQFLSALVQTVACNADVLHKWKVLEVDLSMYIAKLKTVKENLDLENINKVVETLISKSNVNLTDLLKLVITLGNPDALLPILESGKVTIDKDIQDYSYESVTYINPGIVKVLIDFGLIKLADLTVVQVEAMVESIIQYNSRDLCASVSKLIDGLNLKGVKAMKTTLLLQSMSPDLFTVVLDGNKYNLNTKDTSGNSVFGLLCKYGSCATVSELLNRTDIDFDVKNNNGQLCLMLALMNSDKNVPQLLMDAEKVEADVNHCDSYNTSTIAYACVSDNKDMVKVLLAYTTLDVNKKDDQCYTPILYVCSAGAHTTRYIGNELSLQKVKILRRITAVNKSIRCNNSKIAGILLDCDRIDKTQQDQLGNTLVRYGCLGGNDETLSLILKTKAISVNTQNVIGETPLHMACSIGNVKSVKHLLKANAHVNLKSPLGQSPIALACMFGDTDIVKLLLSKNAKVNKTLGVACSCNHTDIVELLLTKNVDVNEEKNGYTPLMVSCTWENAKIVNLLLNKNAIVDKEDREGCTALMIACQKGNVKIVQLLLKKNANVNKIDNYGVTSLMLACQYNHPQVVEILLTKKPNVNVSGGEQYEPALLVACRRKNAKTVSLLLNANCNVNVRNSTGLTALMALCYEGDIDILQLLLTKKVDVNMATPDGLTALMIACQKNDGKIVELLVKNGADVNTTKGTQSPLSYACYSNETIDISIVDLLLRKGANVDDLFICFTPLLFACEMGNMELVSLLFDYNANINLGNKQGLTPLMQSCIYGHTDVIALLLTKNVEVNAVSSTGNTALIYACEARNAKAVSLLLEKNVDLSVINSKRQTALGVAKSLGQAEIVAMLTEHVSLSTD